VSHLKPAKAADFGSQRDSYAETIELDVAFSGRLESPAGIAPDIVSQLDVFNEVMKLGMIVSRSADA
jgi:hypothetical protein